MLGVPIPSGKAGIALLVEQLICNVGPVVQSCAAPSPVVELVDTQVLGIRALQRGGSSPGTNTGK